VAEGISTSVANGYGRRYCNLFAQMKSGKRIWNFLPRWWRGNLQPSAALMEEWQKTLQSSAALVEQWRKTLQPTAALMTEWQKTLRSSAALVEQWQNSFAVQMNELQKPPRG
jgi:hypothetical protein